MDKNSFLEQNLLFTNFVKTNSPNLSIFIAIYQNLYLTNEKLVLGNKFFTKSVNR